MKPNTSAYHTLFMSIGYLIIGAQLLLIVALLAAIAHKTLTPAPVVTRCDRTGESLIHDSTVTPEGTNEQAVKFFLRRFISLYIQKERATEAAEELSYMMTPAFEKVLQFDAWKPPRWEDREIETDFIVRTLRLSGDTANGNTVQVMGTGDLIFRPKAELAAADATAQTVAVFFQATVFVYRVSEKTPHGLMTHWLNLVFFENDELLNTFLDGAADKKEKEGSESAK